MVFQDVMGQIGAICPITDLLSWGL